MLKKQITPNIIKTQSMQKTDSFYTKKREKNQLSPEKEKISSGAQNEVLSILRKHITDENII